MVPLVALAHKESARVPLGLDEQAWELRQRPIQFDLQIKVVSILAALAQVSKDHAMEDRWIWSRVKFNDQGTDKLVHLGSVETLCLSKNAANLSWELLPSRTQFLVDLARDGAGQSFTNGNKLKKPIIQLSLETHQR